MPDYSTPWPSLGFIRIVLGSKRCKFSGGGWRQELHSAARGDRKPECYLGHLIRFNLTSLSLFSIRHTLEYPSCRLTAFSCGIALIFEASSSWIFVSAAEATAMLKNLTLSLVVGLPSPSAMLLVTDKAALSSWDLSEENLLKLG